MTDWNFCKTTSFANAYQTAQRALEVFGVENQIHKCREECLELQDALMNWILKIQSDRVYDKSEAIDEIADVWLTTLQMAHAFGIEKVIERLDFKVERLNGILEKKEYEDEAKLAYALKLQHVDNKNE